MCCLFVQIRSFDQLLVYVVYKSALLLRTRHDLRLFNHAIESLKETVDHIHACALKYQH